jgi:molybdopterin-guanine dinucleotide biosynthesis protein A
MEKDISCVILAGGLNKRFGGKGKSHLEIGGVKIIDRILSVMEELFPELIIVTNTPVEFAVSQPHKIVEDQFKKAGPLGGIHAGLKASSNEAVFVLAGDMPFPDKKIIELQIEVFRKSNYDVIIPKIGNFIEPLHSVYSKSILEKLEKFLKEKKNNAVRDFLMEIKVFYLPLPDTSDNRKAFTNINSPEDLFKTFI